MSVCVCLSVYDYTILALQATRRLMSDTNSFSGIYLNGDFAEMTAFESDKLTPNGDGHEVLSHKIMQSA